MTALNVNKNKTKENKSKNKDIKSLPRIKQPEEDVPDGTVLCQFTIPGTPNTKKTSQRVFKIGKRTVLLPSAQFLAYEKHCKEFCDKAWKAEGKSPMDFGVRIVLKIYLDTWRIGDATGYYQSIGDILEKHGVIANDKFLHWGEDDKHWLEIDKSNPRAEITISRYRHPYEEFRKEKESKNLPVTPLDDEENENDSED